MEKAQRSSVKELRQEIISFKLLVDDYYLPGKFDLYIRHFHDLDHIAPDTWKIYLSTQMQVSEVARLLTVTVFEVSSSFEDVWSDTFVRQYIQRATEATIIAFNDKCKENDFDFTLVAENIMTERRLSEVLPKFLDEVRLCGFYVDEDPELYEPCLELSPGSETLLLIACTLEVIDYLFFSGDDSSTVTLSNLEPYIPLWHYLTIRLKLIPLLDGETVSLNLKQMSILIQMVRCACNVLLSSSYDSIKENLPSLRDGEKSTRDYFKTAQFFLDQSLGELQRANVIIQNLNEDIDWLRLIR